MKQKFKGWAEVAELIRKDVDGRTIEIIDDGQASSLRAVADRLPNNGIIIADEVGMGKTRIAAVIAKAAIAAGGRVAILVPPGLGDHQWRGELRMVGVDSPRILRGLDSYLNAWNEREKKWTDNNVILLSHMFCNWSLKSNTKKNWKWALLPAVLKIQEGRNRASKRVRVGENSNKFDDLRIDAAAKWISDNGSRRYLRKLTKNTEINQWGKNSPLFDPANYTRDTEFRKGLECVVGIGLGIFDLVIIDEAHKNRGEESNLNRLLNQVVLMSDSSRCLAMTATPVELDANQWAQMLDRIRIDENLKLMAKESIVNFADAVAKVRHSLSDTNVREKYKEAAKRFKESLNPYVLRRDKREDKTVIKFKEISGENFHNYRREQEILIDTAHLSAEWKQAVSAAEALSFVSRQTDNTAAKRLRLTLGNGHGVGILIDQVHLNENDDGKQMLLANEAAFLKANLTELNESVEKRMQREAWWKKVLIQPFVRDDSALFSHPAILAAVEEIEQICDAHEKVLVFGKLTRPLKALVHLLNARAMLRCIDKEILWPQAKVTEDSWPAIQVAHQQLKRQGELDRTKLDSLLDEQYTALENQRRNIRNNLLKLIESGFVSIQTDQEALQARALFNIFQKTIEPDSKEHQNDEDNLLVLISRAMHELLGDGVKNASPADFALAFIDFVTAVSNPEEEGKDGGANLESIGASQWETIKRKLKEEYSNQEGSFARLMYGETAPETRRLLQLAFNRKHGHPKVLVAQSLVGREGLNLHKACRTVVLLHPEWNPGVVEQQIGRVDRLDSLWSEKLNWAIEEGIPSADLPRIEIRPVVFKGTYDEKNWEVLQARWDDLRSQLHGVVISPRIANNYPHLHELVDEINNAAPNFSPSD